jgi:pimeloyl-ACP methyl ester carboxylesterase
MTTSNTAKTNPSVDPINRNGLHDLEDAVKNPPAWLTSALSVPREEGFVDVNGCKIHYFEWGDKSKPGIIMAHGFLAHARCFAFIAPYLAADYHIIAYDFSGMGDSGTRETYSIDIRVDELIGVATKTGLFDKDTKPTLIAHSFGGHVGFATFEEHADKFAGLIACDTMVMRPSVMEANAAKFRPPGNQDSTRPNKVYPDYESAKQRFVLSPPQKVEQQALFDYMAFHSLREVEDGWQWKFDPGVFQLDKNHRKRLGETVERIAHTQGKKAIIYGKESLLFNDDSAAYVRETIAKVGGKSMPIIGIPHARHHLMLDQPMALVSALKTQLANWA